ncbi:glycosyltransferase [Actinomadura rudentiformis]|uniref:Glycosyl transferase family 28 n=1 Tax=Actinomadura rudentiformis TaxID=359158 RepID=A0A6H9YF31_9ACTN|nr:glycosyltransferase [Actinomadura rudentiformis]KAB2344035.1 glycosyl transferase family 28 [Actinomadura rudentiformis]
MKPLIFVTVGTDHHRFDRLMDWIDRWLETAGDVRCVVQHGPARAPARAECHEFLPHPEMQALFREATVVVCQGGPGSIMESRQAGRLPIVIPRLAALKEVVDDHQVRFSRHVAGIGKIALAESAEELHDHLNKALADPTAYLVEHSVDETAPAIARFTELVDALVATPRRRRFRLRQRGGLR